MVAALGRRRKSEELLQEDVDPAKRGFPQIRIAEALRDRIDAYKEQHNLPSRPAAIEHALNIAEGKKPQKKPRE